MLHGSKRFRHGSAALLSALIVLLASIATAVPALAAGHDHRPAPSAAAGDTDQVRLVRLPDGRLEVETGPRTRTAGEVVAEGPDVVFGPADLDLPLVDGLVNDQMRRNQWGLDLLQAEEVWGTADGEGQVIAIVDTGVDGEHPDLAPHLVEGHAARGTDPTHDGHGHGTHVAGIAAAVAGDGFGTAGLAHRAAIMPVKVIDDDGLGYASDVAEGVLWAVDHGATVINMSLAGTQRSSVLEAAISHAVDQGVVVVAAAGNAFRDGNPAIHPASHPEVIAVASLSDRDSRSAFSSVGDWVDIAAPGTSILSARPGGVHGFASGTSMAAPLVAAAAALLLQADEELTNLDVAEVLRDTAVDIGAQGWDEEFGEGRIDVLAALTQVAPPAEEPTEGEALADGEDLADALTDGLDGALDDDAAGEDEGEDTEEPRDGTVNGWTLPGRAGGAPVGRLPIASNR